MYLLFVMLIAALYAVHEKLSDLRNSIFANKHPEWFFNSNIYPAGIIVFGVRVNLKLCSAIAMACIIVLSLSLSELSWMRLPLPILIEALVYLFAYVFTYVYFYNKLLNKKSDL